MRHRMHGIGALLQGTGWMLGWAFHSINSPATTTLDVHQPLAAHAKANGTDGSRHEHTDLKRCARGSSGC
jgi:hypothetical protein